MNHKRAFVALFLGFVATGYLGAQEGAEQRKPIPDRDIGLSKSSVFEVPSPDVVNQEASDPGDKPLMPRAHSEAPPLVPHTVTEFLPITWEDNFCIECHLADEAGRSDGKPIPGSHFSDLRNAPGVIGDSVVGARLVCVSCHVAQSGAEPLVGNVFQTQEPVRPDLTQEPVRPDLAGIATEEGWTLANRSATVGSEGNRTVVTFDGRPGDGAAWLDGVEFHNGTIEVLIRGKNNSGRSFVGVAFRGVDDETYDAVYFRPFNFVADNDLSRSHMVQYISHPEHTWSRLREEHTDEYENPLPHPPDPDEFFKARIVVSKPEIRVYVGDDTEPCLVVSELTDRTGGRVGLWMGNGSDGSFAELVIRPTTRDP